MKKNVVHLTFIFVSLITVISALSAQAVSATNPESLHTSTNIINKHKSPDASQEILTTTDHANRKKVLIEESRELSAFFILGIIINIIMVITFSRWFYTQWQGTKKG